jgi:hypothetical protein
MTLSRRAELRIDPDRYADRSVFAFNSTLRRGDGISRSASPSPAPRQRGSGRGSRDTIPPSVRRRVNARDQWCMRCGSPGALHQHHRRLKQQGGDQRAHTDCPCNIVRICLFCHEQVHGKDRRAAEDEGFILPAETTEPGMHPVLLRTADGGMTAFATCAGEWVVEAPAEAVSR